MNIANGSLMAELKKHKGVNIHNGGLRVHFYVPNHTSQKKISVGLPATIQNIRSAALTLSNVKRDIANGLFEIDQETFWYKNFPNNSKNRKKTKTVKQCFKEFKAANANEITDSMQDKLRSAENWLALFNLNGKDIKEISTATLNSIRQKSVRTRKAVTVREYTQTFRKVIKYALEENYIKFDPILGLKPLKKDDQNLEIEDHLIIPFSKAELNQLLKVVHIPQTKRMIELLAWTGLRHGELKALAWEDIELSTGKLKVKYNLTRKGNLKPPKTVAGIRTIDLLPRAIELLQQQMSDTYTRPPFEDVINLANQKSYAVMRRRVFLSRDEQPYKRPELTTTPKQWKTWLAAANLPHRPAYQLRHTFASQLLMAQADPSWLAKQLGHSDWGMIRKIYAKWIDQENPDYIKQLAINLGQKYEEEVREIK